MNFETLRDWRSSVDKINSNQKLLSAMRQEAMDEMDRSLRKLFSDRDIPIKDIEWESDLSVIKVHLVQDTRNQIKFTKKFMIEIGMPFSVRRITTREGIQELFVELYPLEED